MDQVPGAKIAAEHHLARATFEQAQVPWVYRELGAFIVEAYELVSVGKPLLAFEIDHQSRN
jgi:hypothetical protein